MLRRSLHLVLPTCLVAAALTAPAWSAPPFTPACQGDPTCLGTDEPTSGDGVVVHWRVQSATRQTIALESRQPLAGGGTLLTATTATVIVEAGAVRELDARLPIADRGVLAIAGATGPIQAEGVVERDQDGDGYGDGRQDGCSKDFNAHVAPCPASTSFGSALTLAPDPAGFSPAGGGPTAVVQEPNTAPVARAPLDGVVTAFRVRSASTVPLTLQTLRPAGSGAYTVTGAAAPATPAPGGAVTTVTGVRLPVRAGD
ncbi:MAG: calcium-binding protein, partial [Conexibacter sp.]|nr:calcium-binding protein [Conexibacter sp.]